MEVEYFIVGGEGMLVLEVAVNDVGGCEYGRML